MERSRSGVVFVVTAYLIAICLVTATGMRPIRSVLAAAGNLLTHTCIASHDELVSLAPGHWQSEALPSTLQCGRMALPEHWS